VLVLVFFFLVYVLFVLRDFTDFDLFHVPLCRKKKKLKFTTIKKPLVINESSCKGTQEVPNQQSLLRASIPEQISHEKPNMFDVNEASPTAVVATDNADVCNETRQTIPERYVHSFNFESFITSTVHPPSVEVINRSMVIASEKSLS
jgi:hypothetical protein